MATRGFFGRRPSDQDAARLPPGQYKTEDFPVLSAGATPRVDLATWRFTLKHGPRQLASWSWEEFNQLPKTRIKRDIHCVTKWSKFNTTWEGVSVPRLVDEGLIKIKPEANYVIQHAEYGYTVNLPIEVVLAENFLLATHFNGEPIDPDHGYPLRGVVGAIPGRDDLMTPYLWKGAKWLRGLEFRATDREGFWEQAGYHNEADVWKEQRFKGR